MGAEVASADRLLEPLLSLHERVRTAVVDACGRQATEQLAAVASDDAQNGDTIYAVDRVAEETFVQGLQELAPEESLCVVGEGLSGQSLPEDGRWRLLVDPIDGTRGLMYQKRSAWILTGVAPNRGPGTRLRDIVLAVQTEIPLLKQHLSDQLWAMRGQGTEARRFNRLSGARERLPLSPSRADTIAHGFATVVRFFPGARDVLAAIDDEVAQALVVPPPGQAACFEDQYASTGGQLYELMAGHDRFIADLRALVAPEGLCCHPYDLCTALIAEEGGVVVTDAGGAALDAPFDVTTNVAWVGYANARLRASVEPVLQGALKRRGLLP
jgi:fructose-1,6-bisphosphatase/inositol monophosphatase family enzyme